MPPGRKLTFSPEQIQEILALRNQKLSFAEIKKQLNLKTPITKIKNSLRYHRSKMQIPPPLNGDNSTIPKEPEKPVEPPKPETEKKN